jgi:hypothetical protein
MDRGYYWSIPIVKGRVYLLFCPDFHNFFYCCLDSLCVLGHRRGRGVKVTYSRINSIYKEYWDKAIRAHCIIDSLHSYL